MKTAEITTPLKEHQARVVERIKEQPGLVVAHGLGSGKTLSSIAASEALGGPTSVVVPAALRTNYQKELRQHVKRQNARYQINSLQQASRRGHIPKAKLLVVDEAHRLRDPGSKAQKAVAEAEAEKRLLLTGTPLYNRPYDLASLVNVAAGGPVFPKDRVEFERRYIAQKEVDPGLIARVFRGVKPGSVTELRNTDELRERLGKWVDYYENEASKDFPIRRGKTIPVTMSPRQQELYNAIIGRAPAWVSYKVRSGLPPSKQEAKELNAFLGAVRGVSVTPGGYVEGVTPEQAAEMSPKVQKAFSALQGAIKKNPEHRALVYSHFLESGISPYESLLKKHQVPYGKFTGEVSKADRDQMVREYNEGKLRALLLSSAGGEGLDLKGTRQIQILDPHWNKEKLEQVIGRGIRYKSHEHLPEDQRTVDVEQYLSTHPEPGFLGRLVGSKRPGSVDEYLTSMSAEKDRLNQQVRDILRETSKARASSATKTSMIGPQVFSSFVKELAGI